MLSVDAQAGQHAISPDVYGINFYWDLSDKSAASAAAAPTLRPTARRWGGNNTSTYNWKYDVSNIDADWFYEVLPDTSINAAKQDNGLVSTAVRGVRVLFDGIPAPLVYESAAQVSAVVPYFGVIQANTHVQVEYQGVRSDAMVLPVSATAPGLFSRDYSGRGLGVISESGSDVQ